MLSRIEPRASLQRRHTRQLLQHPSGKIPCLCFIVCCENKPNYKPVESMNQTSNPLAKEEPVRLDSHSIHCFCFLFLEHMSPMRPMVAKPSPAAMLAALMASVTCNRERGESGSVSRIWEQGHSTRGTSYAPFTSRAKPESQQILPGSMGKEDWERKNWTEPAGLEFTRTQNGSLN